MLLMFDGADVKHCVRVAGWERDMCLGAEVHCRGWSKRFRIPMGKVQNEDVRAVLNEFQAQSQGGILMSERSIQMLVSEGLVKASGAVH